MDRTRADDTSSDVAVADASTTNRRRGRDGDPLYRRPPAQPPAESTTGGSWFTDGTEMPVDEPVPADVPAAEPRYGPAPPATSGRTSFGFSAGPISPARSAPAAAAPGRRDPEPAPEPTGLPIRRQGDAETPARRSGGRIPAPEFPTGGHAAVTTTGSHAAVPTTGSYSAVTTAGSYEAGTSTGSHAAGRPGNAPVSPHWPPPARLEPDPSTFDRMSTGGHRALRSTSGEWPAAEWPGDWAAPDDTGEQRAPRRGPDRPSADSTGERRAVVPEPPRKQSRVVTVGITMLSAIVLVTGTVVGIVYFSGSDQKLDSVLQLGAGPAAQNTVTAPLDNRSRASFELLAGANKVHVTIGELGDDLYRISTPDDAGIKPEPEIRNDEVKLQVTKDGDGIGGEIEVVLAAKVRWGLRFSGYAETQVVDVSGGQISGIEMVAGMRRAEITLSQPTGTVPVKINGAVDTLVLRSPVANPVRIKVGGGAQTVMAGTRTLKDVKAGSTLTPKGWNTTNRYDLIAGARITSLTVANA